VTMLPGRMSVLHACLFGSRRWCSPGSVVAAAGCPLTWLYRACHATMLMHTRLFCLVLLQSRYGEDGGGGRGGGGRERSRSPAYR
jgi:hypothetical protein